MLDEPKSVEVPLERGIDDFGMKGRLEWEREEIETRRIRSRSESDRTESKGLHDKVLAVRAAPRTSRSRASRSRHYATSARRCCQRDDSLSRQETGRCGPQKTVRVPLGTADRAEEHRRDTTTLRAALAARRFAPRDSRHVRAYPCELCVDPDLHGSTSVELRFPPWRSAAESTDRSQKCTPAFCARSAGKSSP